MIRRAAWFGIASLVAACSQTGLDPGDDAGVGTGSGGASVTGAAGSGGAHDGGSFDVGEGFCGNRIVDPAFGETCDDGNQVPGDGCSPLCQVECCWSCGSCSAGGPCVGTAVCGDGIRNGGEQCDDGNLVAGDGCAGACAVEDGWYCPIAGLRASRSAATAEDRRPRPATTRTTPTATAAPRPVSPSRPTRAVATASFRGPRPAKRMVARSPPSLVPQAAATCTTAATAPSTRARNATWVSLATSLATGTSGCTPACKRAHYCGDGIVDPGEICDFGAGNNDIRTFPPASNRARRTCPRPRVDAGGSGAVGVSAWRRRRPSTGPPPLPGAAGAPAARP